MTPTDAHARQIRLAGVHVDLDGRRILHDIDLELDAQRIAVIGANGSGKSTFARLLNGLITPTAGTVHVHGLDVARQRAAVRHAVGFVFTNPDAQILMPTVGEDVRFSLRSLRVPRAEVDSRVTAVLDRYGLAELADAPAYSLSGGQKQLLALASVLVREPSLIIADEPTTLLDLGNARMVSDLLITDVAAQSVIVTHDLELALRCDIAVRFRDGRLDDVGEPARLVGRYRHEFA